MTPALAWVRLATTIRRGRASIKGPSTPAAAPPAPISSTSRPARSTPALRAMSLTRPTPSVLSAKTSSPSKRSVLQACASCARGVSCVASGAASNLKGTVTLQPLPPSARNACTDCGEAVERDQPLAVFQVLAGELRETRVDPRRLAVLHRVAHDAVEVGRHRSTSLASSVPSRAKVNVCESEAVIAGLQELGLHFVRNRAEGAGGFCDGLARRSRVGLPDDRSTRVSVICPSESHGHHA